MCGCCTRRRSARARRAPRRGAPAPRPAAPGAAGRGRRPCRSSRSQRAAAPPRRAPRAIAPSFSCRPRWTAAQGGCTAIDSARRSTASRGSSESCTQAIESMICTAPKRSRVSSSSSSRHLAEQAVRARACVHDERQRAHRASSAGSPRRCCGPCAGGRGGSPWSSMASRSRGRRRPAGSTAACPRARRPRAAPRRGSARRGPRGALPKIRLTQAGKYTATAPGALCGRRGLRGCGHRLAPGGDQLVRDGAARQVAERAHRHAFAGQPQPQARRARRARRPPSGGRARGRSARRARRARARAAP